MSGCPHEVLTLVPKDSNKLRCQRCHLTLSPDELVNGCCPECYEVRGEKHSDFEKVEEADDAPTRYRCDRCGMVIEC